MLYINQKKKKVSGKEKKTENHIKIKKFEERQGRSSSRHEWSIWFRVPWGILGVTWLLVLRFTLAWMASKPMNQICAIILVT